MNAGLEEFCQDEWLGRWGISEGMIFRKEQFWNKEVK